MPLYYTPAVFCLLLLIVLLSYYWHENSRHQANLTKIGLRIHVNGTRGKSSVTRLIAAGLRAGGLRVVAKTTGTAARLILPDGSEQALVRSGPANIRELVAVVNKAAGLRAEALVIECMAVRPELQWFSEHRLVKAHIGVITNVRQDHEEVMGLGLDNIARALSSTVPDRGITVTTKEALEQLAQTAAIKAAETVYAVSREEVPSSDYEGFDYEVIPDNIVLALKVCELAGVERKIAIAGMRGALPDEGNITVQRYVSGLQTVTLINALAANDPQSTVQLWERYVDQTAAGRAIIFNCRKDRQFRTAQLCRELSKIHQGLYAIAGDSSFARRKLLQAGISAAAILLFDPRDIPGSLQKICARLPDGEVVIFAAGNIRGLSDLTTQIKAGAKQACTSCLQES